MKRAIFLLIIVLAGWAPLLPCDVHMETCPATAIGKDNIQVKLFVELIHRRCPVPIEKTRLETSGLTIEKQGEWKEVEAGIYQMDLVISLKGKSKGEIRVLRECPKTGLQKEVLEIKPLK